METDKEHFGRQARKLLEVFKERGQMMTSEIMALGFASHTRRITDLRKDGWVITRSRVSGTFEHLYVLEGRTENLQMSLI